MLNYKEFKRNKDGYLLTESFFKNIMSSIKDKLSLSLSKKIGGAKKVDKLINIREEELKSNLENTLKLEEELLKSKKAYQNSQDNENLRLQYEQKKKALIGEKAAMNKVEKASKKKFDISVRNIKKKSNDVIADYIDLRILETDMLMAQIEVAAFKKMGRDSSKLQTKLSKYEETLKTKKEAIESKIRKKDEESKDVDKIDMDSNYSYTNSKGIKLVVKVLNDKEDNEGFIKVVNKEKEGKSDGFRVKRSDLTIIEKEETKEETEEES